MLLRLIVENIASFKDTTEFNMFPSSKSQNHNNHKIKCGHATVLRMSAIYGANGAGKSNLIKGMQLLQTMVKEETLNKFEFYNFPFMLSSGNNETPMGIAIEFYNDKNVYYYHIEFSAKEVVTEDLFLSQKSKDIELFTRNKSKITINSKYVGKDINALFADVLKRIVRPDMLLLPFLGKYYSEEAPIVSEAYKWITLNLQIVLPTYKYNYIPTLLDTDSEFANMTNFILPEFKTGVKHLKVKKRLLTDEDITDENYKRAIELAKSNPNVPQRLVTEFRDVINIVYEQGKIISKTIVAVHTSIDGREVEFPISDESDGTRRLIEYMPLLYEMVYKGKIYIVDEIERSLHPIMIKDIISKISESTTVKGQLIFTTHESCLLDLSIFRPDEIWFAQKDVEQATQLYPLSDFNIHKTANIENGYLDGRYGGIPFLSNLKDLNW